MDCAKTISTTSENKKLSPVAGSRCSGTKPLANGDVDREDWLLAMLNMTSSCYFAEFRNCL